jgi:hypothetical protein
MKLTLNVKDEKASFFIELIQNLDFVQMNDDFDIPEEHKQIVMERIKNASPDKLFKWENIKDNFKFGS